LVLVLSTNLDPRTLADEAFLRRIGYKVPFAPSTREEYSAIFRQGVIRTARMGPEFGSLAHRQLHAKNGVPLLPCHPRDLGLALTTATGVDAVDETCGGLGQLLVAPGAVRQLKGPHDEASGRADAAVLARAAVVAVSANR
jgi:hypothetical protein